MNTATHEVAPRPDSSPAAEAASHRREARVPRVDVVETADAFLVTADVPGVPMDAIEITLEKDRLELVARRREVPPEGHRAAFRQYGEGDYRRAFRVPDGVDRGAIHADLRDGVLRIALPKAAPPQPQKVLVQAS